MSHEPASYIGGVPSADIAVPEHPRELRFYSQVLGTGASPLWREDLLNNLGAPIIGLGESSPEYAGLPLQWMPHIWVADVAASVVLAEKLGGATLMHGKDDEGESQWAVLRDPDGAAFGVIPIAAADQPAPQECAPLTDKKGGTGRIARINLTVRDAKRACDFYRQVIGWSVQEVKQEDAGESYADYNMLHGGGQTAAGVCHARGENLDLPPVWILDLPVADLQESLLRVEAEGGKFLMKSLGTDGEVASAVIQDPVGACLALVQD